MSAGEGAAKDALSHAIAKAYHNTDRTAGIDSHAINVKRSPPVTLTDELQAIVAKFTSKKGRPLNWTSLSVSQRIAIIAKSFNKNIATQLNASYLMIYSDASEIIHGSYLGSLMTHGRDPLSTFSLHGRSFKDVHDHHHESSLLAAFLSIHSTLDAFCQYSNVAGDPFELKDNFAEFSKIILTK